MAETIEFSNPQFQTLLTERLWAMLHNKQWTDVIFDCRGTKLAAHRLIVCVVAPEIKAVLGDSMTIGIDVEANIFKLLIEYMYKGRIYIQEDQLDDVKKGAELMYLECLAKGIESYTRAPTKRQDDIQLHVEKSQDGIQLHVEKSQDDTQLQVEKSQDNIQLLVEKSQDDIQLHVEKSQDDIQLHNSSKLTEVKAVNILNVELEDDAELVKKLAEQDVIFDVLLRLCDSPNSELEDGKVETEVPKTKDKISKTKVPKSKNKTPKTEVPKTKHKTPEKKKCKLQDKKHSCSKCDYVCTGWTTMVEHRKSVHGNKKQKEFKCQECEFVSDKFLLLGRHVQNCHSTDRPWACKHCDYRSKSSSDLAKHVEYHSKEKIQCPVCDKIVKTKRILSTHMLLHTTRDVTSKKPHVCNFCSYRCIKRSQLIKHCKTKHNSEAPKQIKRKMENKFDNPATDCELKCEFCSYYSNSLENLWIHLTVKHGVKDSISQFEPAIKCQLCQYKSNSTLYYSNHLAVVHGVDEEGNSVEPTFKCQRCEYKSAISEFYWNHLAAKHGVDEEGNRIELVFTCQLCEYKTKYHVHYSNHLAVKHQQDEKGNRLEPKFQCPSCEFKGYTPKHVSGHQQCSHPKKRYYCEMCDFSTLYKALFDRHIKAKHLNKKPFVCETCGLRLISNGELRRHALIHGNEKFDCPICGKSYSLKSYLQRHMRIIHDKSGPRFMCELCAFKTRTLDALKQHVARMHSEIKPPPRQRKNVKKTT